MKKAPFGECVIVICLLFLPGCDDPVPAPPAQAIYFEVAYTNSAWTNQQRGFVIDGKGTVRTYDKPTSWFRSSLKEEITRARVEESLRFSTSSPVTISPSELAACTKLLPQLRADRYSKRVNMANDSGELYYFAYLYDAKREVFTPVLLQEDGDWHTKNLDTSATVMVAMLKNIQAQVYKEIR